MELIDQYLPTGTMDQETIDLMRRQVEIQNRLLKLNQSHGIAFYRPHYLQHCFHTATAKRRGMFAGNRFGKSQANAAETVAWLLGERPWYKIAFDIYGVDHENGKNRRMVLKYAHPGGDNHPFVKSGIPPYPTKQVVVCTNWEKVHEIWTSRESHRPGKIWQFLPNDGEVKATTNNAGVIDEIHYRGAMLKFMSVDAFKKNKLTAESSDWDRVAFDEPGPQNLWKGLARGLVDRDGQGDFTLTSLEELWIYEYFNIDDLPESMKEEITDRFSFRGTMYDNPHLSDRSIRRFISELTEDELQCRILGLPLELSGLVYKEFSRVDHVLKEVPQGWTDYHLPAKSCVLHCRVDTHPVKPHMVLFAAVGPEEIPIICHEIYLACDALTLAQTIKAYIRLTGCYLASIKVEPAAWIKDSTTRVASIASIMRSEDLFVRPASKDLTNGILLVKSAFKGRKILLSPKLKRLPWELARYRYNPETGDIVDAEDHACECLYRLVIDKPRWFDPDGAGTSFPIGDESYETVPDLTVSSLD